MFLAGVDIYEGASPAVKNTWPPSFSVYCTPLAIIDTYLGRPLTKEIWYFFNFLIFILLIKLWHKMIYEKELSFFPSADSDDLTKKDVLLPILICLPAIIRNFFDLQINILLLYLISLALYYHSLNRKTLAGFLIAFAATAKAFPGIFLIYYLFRKQWRISIYIMVFGLLLSLTPILFYGVYGFKHLVTSWINISFQQPYLVIAKFPSTYGNQSIYAVIQYYFSYGLELFEPGAKPLNLLHKLVSASLIFGSLFIFSRKQFNVNSLQVKIEYASMCVLMFIVSPISWRHYWVFIYPATVITYYMINSNLALPSQFQKTYRFWVALLIIPVFLGSAVYSEFRHFGSMMWATLICNYLLVKLHQVDIETVGVK